MTTATYRTAAHHLLQQANTEFQLQDLRQASEKSLGSRRPNYEGLRREPDTASLPPQPRKPENNRAEPRPRHRQPRLPGPLQRRRATTRQFLRKHPQRRRRPSRYAGCPSLHRPGRSTTPRAAITPSIPIALSVLQTTAAVRGGHLDSGRPPSQPGHQTSQSPSPNGPCGRGGTGSRE